MRRAISPGMRIVDSVFFLLTLLAGGLLSLAYLAPYIDPNRHVWFAFLGLIAPFLYVGNLLLLLYWTLRWRGVAFVSLALLLLGTGYVGRYVRPQIRQAYTAEERPEGTIRVLSYNVGGFWGKEQGRAMNRMDQIARFLREENPDILCLQEYEINHVNTAARFDSLLEPFKYRAVSFAWNQHDAGWGLAVYSRYRILDKGSMTFPESTNSAMWVDLVAGRDTVRVFNCHLQITGVNEEDRGFLHPEAMAADSLREDKAKNIVRKLERNFKKRALQADSLAGVIHDGRPRVIVCGDFNDTPMSYVYEQVRGDLTDAFQQQGRGMVYTYRGLRGLFRIDYIFHSEDFRSVDYRTDLSGWSDHNPVMVDLKPAK